MNRRILSGTAEEWGLPPARLEALEAELADHAACLAERGVPEAVDELKTRANSGSGRRLLAGPHFAEQVASTLARWPSRSEWRELMWLLAWFAVILVSDSVAFRAGGELRAAGLNLGTYPERLATPAVAGWVTAAWLLQGVARTGFFTSFTVSLVRAWRTGKGVLLARILQLKLIHTVLVVAAMWAFGNWLGEMLADWLGGGWSGFNSIPTDWPQWLTAPYLLAYGLAIALFVLLMSKRRLWGWALGITLCMLFLYPAAPVQRFHVTELQPIVATVDIQNEQSNVFKNPNPKPGILVPDDANRTLINELYASYLESGTHNFGRRTLPSSVDAETNTIRYEYEENAWVRGTLFGQPDGKSYYSKIRPKLGRSYVFLNMPYLQEIASEYRNRYYVERTPGSSYLPVFSPHAALAWLAAPIPVLGLVGLLGMLVLMGRRGFGDMLAYGALVFFALASTFLPFFYSGAMDRLVDLTPSGIVTGPLPGFDSLLIGSRIEDVWTLILGLLLSAGIPWVLVALFLKPKPPRVPDDIQQLAE